MDLTLERLQRIVKSIQDTAESAWPCVLCSSPTHSRGIFFPGNPDDFWTYGTWPVFIYALCDRHDSTQAEVLYQIDTIIYARYASPQLTGVN